MSVFELALHFDWAVLAIVCLEATFIAWLQPLRAVPVAGAEDEIPFELRYRYAERRGFGEEYRRMKQLLDREQLSSARRIRRQQQYGRYAAPFFVVAFVWLMFQPPSLQPLTLGKEYVLAACAPLLAVGFVWIQIAVCKTVGRTLRARR